MEKKVKLSFEEELISLMPKLKNYAWRLTNNVHNCEDLVGETILSALNHKSKFIEGTNMKAWVFTIMHNSFVNGYRHKVRFGNNVEYHELKGGGFSIESYIDTKQEFEHVIDFINHQEERLITPIMLYSEGYQYEEIADMTGIPTGTIKSRIFQMRKKLKQIA